MLDLVGAFAELTWNLRDRHFLTTVQAVEEHLAQRVDHPKLVSRVGLGRPKLQIRPSLLRGLCGMQGGLASS